MTIDISTDTVNVAVGKIVSITAALVSFSMFRLREHHRVAVL